MDSFYSRARCPLRLAKVQRRLIQFSRSQQKCTLIRRGTAFADPSPCFTIVHPVISSRFLLFPFKTSQIQVIFKVLQADTTIQQFLFLYLRYFVPPPHPCNFYQLDLTFHVLFLVLDFWYNISPPHPRTLRGAYGYLPDCANLFE
jgi:hypothetical protein